MLEGSELTEPEILSQVLPFIATHNSVQELRITLVKLSKAAVRQIVAELAACKPLIRLALENIKQADEWQIEDFAELTQVLLESYGQKKMKEFKIDFVRNHVQDVCEQFLQEKRKLYTLVKQTLEFD